MTTPGVPDKSPGVTRKQFLLSFWWLAAGVLLLQIAGAIGWLLWPKKRGQPLANVWYAGNIAEYEVGEVRIFETEKLFVSKVSADAVIVMSWRCTHLGCPLYWHAEDPSLDSLKPAGKISCHCHEGDFDRFGINRFGVPPRPLDLFDARIDDDGGILIDLSGARQRRQYEESQLVKKPR